MKLIYNYLYAFLLFVATIQASAQSFSQNFNIRNGTGNCDRTVYSDQCWLFKSTSVASTNSGGCNVLTGQLSNPSTTTVTGGNRVNFPYEVTTPALTISSPASVTFTASVTPSLSSRPVLYVLADPVSSTSNSFTLATITTSATGLTSTTKSFVVSFTPPSGNYTIRFGMLGSGGNSRIVLDDIFVSTVTAVAQPPTCQFIPMPVEFISFEGRPTGNQVQLTWVTSWERNADRFEVQRSQNATEFGTIGEVRAAGDATQKQVYGFTDEQALTGINYYRLRQVDHDGSVQFSPIIAVTTRPEVAAIAVLGNPVEGGRIDLQLFNIDASKLQLTDVQGRSVACHITESASGLVALEPTNPLSNGVYLVRVAKGPVVRIVVR